MRRNLYNRQNSRNTGNVRQMNMSIMSGGAMKSETNSVEEQMSRINFDGQAPKMNTVSDVMNLNKHSSIRDSKLNNELPSGSGLPMGKPPMGKPPMGKGVDINVLKKLETPQPSDIKIPTGNLPGEVLKRKLLLRMLKEKEKKKGGNLLLPNTSSGQSVSKELGKQYKIKGGSVDNFKLSFFVRIISTAAVKNMSLRLKDFPLRVQLDIKKGYDEIKLNPTKEVIESFSKSFTPIIKSVFPKLLKNFESNVSNLLISKLT